MRAGVGAVTRFLPVLLLATAFAAATPAAANSVDSIRLTPRKSKSQWVKQRSASCIRSANISGAIIMDARNVDIYMRDGSRWRMRLAHSCSQLGYYGSFYLKPAHPGRICAGTDRLIGRAGGSCRVTQIFEMQKLPPPKADPRR